MSIDQSIAVDVSLVPRISLLSKVGMQVLWYLLWKEAKGQVNKQGYVRLKYKDAINVCSMSNNSNVAAGVNDLLECDLIERGPINGWYRIKVKGLGLKEGPR